MITGLVSSTAFKYLIAIVATWAAEKLGLDPTEGKASIEGVISQLIAFVMAAWGIWESTRAKIVSPDKTVVHLDKPQIGVAEEARVNTLADALKKLVKR